MASSFDPMLPLAKELFPICRSLTGHGFRESLKIINDRVGGMSIHSIPSGTACFDWTVPREWNIRDAYIKDPKGRIIAAFKSHNLHVVGYSIPIRKIMPLEELNPHLHSLPERPDAIPYVTTYYKENWGFCLTHRQHMALEPGDYEVVIDSSLEPGVLNYGEVVIPGSSSQEVFLSTYLCHPSMANNELSGPVVASQLILWLKQLKERRYTYRIIFIPETIGSVAYLSRNLAHLQKSVVAGFNLTCLGDERTYSFLPSREGTTLSDRAAQHALKYIDPHYKSYTFLDRGSDERQYCSPGVDLPIASIMRSKYGTFPEYHTSDDDFSLVTETGLQGGFEALQKALMAIEANEILQATVLCEPQLGKRGLYPTLSTVGSSFNVQSRMDLLAYADGRRDLLAIAETIQVPIWDLLEDAALLKEHGLLISR